MDAERWTRVQALFHAALERPEAERPAFVAGEAERVADPALAADVLALLEEDAAGGSLLDRDLGALARGVLDAPRLRTAGPYRVLSELGRGGMGVVYLAERDDLGHRVAIKVLRDAALSAARRARFAHEERTLARLSHPAIARLYGAGALPDGTPYFVMEHVEGVPVTAYCAAHGCSVPHHPLVLERILGRVPGLFDGVARGFLQPVEETLCLGRRREQRGAEDDGEQGE